ncbi:RluA family pseudouridine synthase [Stieleria sp. JC731]|uniref:RluA family pseudouridine synthase n=1 Tax=Pirellulaceae TaxID=2691357 RepID=UPI001E4CC7CE|nr:RluA family pseudouridine synthase [Stieleria sp. JC731]MCC9602640.1 RluA family pseudouridine synthase [Stieleria sp. JC731]
MNDSSGLDSPIEIVWQCDIAIAVNKPSGIATQAPAGIDSVETRLTSQLGREEDYLAFPHRLDRAVSGVLLVALSKRAARLLSGQFATRKTSKQYIAIVEGTADVDECWEDYLCKLQGKPQTEVVSAETEGAKRATTNVSTIEIDRDNNQTRLLLKPHTGRMHQLRVQTSSRGFPIVGDDLYGAEHPVDAVSSSGNESHRRILLHACQLDFHHPVSGKRISVFAPCPF